jgi:hypothetical protein
MVCKVARALLCAQDSEEYDESDDEEEDESEDEEDDREQTVVIKELNDDGTEKAESDVRIRRH